MRKNKHIKQILFPCLGVIGAASIVIPMSIMCTSRHVIIKAEQRRIELENIDNVTIDVTLSSPILEGQELIITTRPHPTSISNCYVDVTTLPPVIGSNTITINLKIVRNDYGSLQDDDKAKYDLMFKMQDQNMKTIWKDQILNMELIYKEAQHD